MGMTTYQRLMELEDALINQMFTDDFTDDPEVIRVVNRCLDEVVRPEMRRYHD